MLYSQSTPRLSLVAFFIIAIYTLLSFTSVYAKTGCCSKHGGVAGCNNATGYQLCKDGTTSPSCTCSGETIKQSKATTAGKATAARVKPTPTMKAQTTSETAATAKTKPYRLAGCCSGHGGVAKCDAKTGYQICKDGTHSTTCACGKEISKKK